METDQIKEQLAEAIRAGNYEDATRIALDLIEQLELSLDEKEKMIKELRMKNYFAHQGYASDDPASRIYQKGGGEE